MAGRTFTLEEAQALLPVLESLLRTAIDGKKLIESVDGELQEVAHHVFLNGGTHLNIVHLARRNKVKLATFDAALCEKEWSRGVAEDPTR